MDNSNARILKQISESIEQFRAHVISIDDLVANLSGNITALEGADSEFLDRFQGFIGEIDFIKYTEEKSLSEQLILEEVNNYSEYLQKYFT